MFDRSSGRRKKIDQDIVDQVAPVTPGVALVHFPELVRAGIFIEQRFHF
jgi:hypothetical protein